MTFPTIQTADTKTGHVTSNSTSWTLTYPTNLANGDLILAFVATDGNPVATWPAGWKDLFQSSLSAVRLHWAKKLSDGTETGNFTLSLDASEQGSWVVYRVTGWEGTIGSSNVFDNFGVNTGSAVAASAQSSSANPDPPSLDPVNWGAEDTLWFAVMAADTSRTVSAFPTNYADNQYSDPSGGANGATLGVATRNLNATSEDPGTFTISASDDWSAATIAIRPAAAAAATSLLIPHRHRGLIVR